MQQIRNGKMRRSKVATGYALRYLLPTFLLSTTYHLLLTTCTTHYSLPDTHSTLPTTYPLLASTYHPPPTIYPVTT